MRTYGIVRRPGPPPPTCDWDDPYWRGCQVADVDQARPESGAHRPRVQVKVAHDGGAVHGIFQVHDRHVRAVAERYQDQVCRDSCVEFFFKPSAGPGYFNLEMGAGGVFLLYYIRDCTPVGDGYADMVEIPWEDGRQVTLLTTLPRRVDPEIPGPVLWRARFSVPVGLVEKYAGPVGDLGGQRWTGNFYKCADGTSHPHWLAWSPVSSLNFHLPECFGVWNFN